MWKRDEGTGVKGVRGCERMKEGGRELKWIGGGEKRNEWRSGRRG